MKLFSCLALLMATSGAFCQDANLYFNPNSETMRLNDVLKLETIIGQYRQKKFPILLKGYTDTTGSAAYNLSLSRRRAASIKSYLVAHKVNTSDVTTQFFGEAATTGRGQSYDRRVEVFAGAEDRNFSSYRQLIESMQPETQTFLTNPDEPTTIEGKKGTLVQIPLNAFHYSDGRPVTGAVKIELAEYYSLSEFIGARLSTVSDGQLIVSSGMVNIKAFSGSSEVYLNEGEELQISFPKRSEDDFETFTGERLADGRMNWKLQARGEARAPLNPNDIGVYISADGTLEVSDKKTATEKLKGLYYDGATGRYIQLNEKEEKQFRKFMAEQRATDSTRKEFYTTISSRRMDWINCDRFLNEPSGPIEYYVKATSAGTPVDHVYIIYKELKSLVELNKDGDKYGMKMNVPLTRPCWLLALGERGGKFYLYVNRILPANGKTELIEMKEQPFGEFKKSVRKLMGS